MTSVFVDTSAVYAALDGDDRRHGEAATSWARLFDGLEDATVDAFTHSGIVVEAAALVQHRLGMAAARALHHDLLPLLEITSVDAPLHRRAVAALLAANRREVSLVDWTSFELMRERALDTAFAFDDRFWEQGFSPWA